MQKINNILKEHNIKILKKYGQNFLVDQNIIEKIVKNLDPKINNILEIGPGLGAITDNILKEENKIIAIEIDQRISKLLKNKYGTKVKIINNDVLKVNFAEIENKYFNNNKYSIISNLPYYITSPIIFKILETTKKCNSFILMMQKEVGERILAKQNSKKYNNFSLICEYYCDIKKITNVPASCFFPKPKVDSVVISFKINKTFDLNFEEEKEFIDFIKKMFTFNRKTILNNLSIITHDKINAEKILKNLKFNTNLRPCNLSLKNCYNLFIEVKRLNNAN